MALVEIARRLRAARAYGGFRGRQDFTEAIEMSPSTLQRIEDGKRPLREGERLLIARKCGVPEWFLESGWDGRRRQGGGSIDDLAQKALVDIQRAGGGEQEQRGTG